MGISGILMRDLYNPNDWEPMQAPRTRTSKIDTDKVYFCATRIDSKIKRTVKQKWIITIGKDIADLLGLNENTRIESFTFKKEPGILRIKRSINPSAYKLSKKGCNYFVHFPASEYFAITETGKSCAVNFELFTDNAFMIDIRKYIIQQVNIK